MQYYLRLIVLVHNSFRVRSCFLLFVCCVITNMLSAQTPTETEKFISRLRPSAAAPEGLISTRSAVLFDATCTQEELEKIQKGFQQTGIDAVTYVPVQAVLAGVDVKNYYSNRFGKRNIKFLFIIRKQNQEYQFWCTAFNTKNAWTNPAPTAWMIHAPRLNDALLQIFRALAGGQKKQNFLINEFPEMESPATVFMNTRNETMIGNLKSFRVAVPGLSDGAADKELLEYFNANFHGRFESAPDTVTDRQLLQKGVRYVLRFVHAPGALAKELMGYDVNKAETVISSVTYVNGNIQLKMIPSTELVYKFYLKDLEDRNVYLGPKWDGDVTWQDALKNHFDAYRATGRLN